MSELIEIKLHLTENQIVSFLDFIDLGTEALLDGAVNISEALSTMTADMVKTQIIDEASRNSTECSEENTLEEVNV